MATAIRTVLTIALLSYFSLVFTQIDYGSDKWIIPASVYEAIRFHETLCKNVITEQYNGTIEKLVVSAFIGKFKYAGGFQSEFPQLKNFDPMTRRMCESNSQDCLHFIYRQLTTVSLEAVNYMYGPKTYPGRSRHVVTIRHKHEQISPSKLFAFQSTSMIYLCYWSILVDDAINDMDWSCLMPGKTFTRTTRSRCMLNAVCPNPCCAGHRVNDTSKNCDQFGQHLCTAITNVSSSACFRHEGHNFYRELSVSEFAVSGPSFQCGCLDNKEWHSKFLGCLDQDECLNGSDKCNRTTQYCVNRPKGYFCACRWGHRPVSRYLCEPKQLESLTQYPPNIKS